MLLLLLVPLALVPVLPSAQTIPAAILALRMLVPRAATVVLLLLLSAVLAIQPAPLQNVLNRDLVDSSSDFGLTECAVNLVAVLVLASNISGGAS